MINKRTKARKCFDMYRGKLHRFGRFVEQFLKENRFDITFIDHSLTAASGVVKVVKKTGCKILTQHIM